MTSSEAFEPTKQLSGLRGSLPHPASTSSASHATHRRRRDRILSRAKGHNVGNVERYASVAAGGALVVAALARRTWSSVAMGLVGGELLWRGLTGRCPVYGALGVSTAVEAPKVVKEVRRTVTIRRRPDEIFAALLMPDTLPRVMAHVADVVPVGENRARWRVHGAVGPSLEWETSIVDVREPTLLQWESLPGARVPHAGTITLRPAPRDLGTEVTIRLVFSGPGGLTGALGGRVLRLAPSTVLATAAWRFKALLECGEIPMAS